MSGSTAASLAETKFAIVYSSHSDWIGFLSLDLSLPYMKQIPITIIHLHKKIVQNVCGCEIWKRAWGQRDGVQ